MAEYDLFFKDQFKKGLTIQTKKSLGCFIDVIIKDEEDEFPKIIRLDKSTAIKFAKTLRTEINKITESEVSNG